jgi:hypothetical protein
MVVMMGRHLHFSHALATRDLGYEPITSLDEGLELTINYFLHHNSRRLAQHDASGGGWAALTKSHSGVSLFTRQQPQPMHPLLHPADAHMRVSHSANFAFLSAGCAGGDEPSRGSPARFEREALTLTHRPANLQLQQQAALFAQQMQAQARAQSPASALLPAGQGRAMNGAAQQHALSARPLTGESRHRTAGSYLSTSPIFSLAASAQSPSPQYEPSPTSASRPAAAAPIAAPRARPLSAAYPSGREAQAAAPAASADSDALQSGSSIAAKDSAHKAR